MTASPSAAAPRTAPSASPATLTVTATDRMAAASRGRTPNAVLAWFYRPAQLTFVAMLVGWFAIYFAYQDDWLGVILALGTTVGGFFAVHRGRVLGRERRAALEAAVGAAATRNRQLEQLRRLGSTLLGVRSSGELLEEVTELAGDLLQAHGSAIMLVVEEGRFLRVAAGSGLMRQASGSLLPVDRSIIGWCVANDQSLICDDMESDPRNFPIDTLPAQLERAICVPLRSSGVVIGAVSAYNRLDGQPFGDHDITLLSALAEQVAVGLDRAFMLDHFKRHTEEVVRTIPKERLLVYEASQG